MSEPIPIGAGSGSFLARIDLHRHPDGRVSACLVEMPNHVIEHQPTITKRFFLLSEWCLKASLDFMRQGVRFDEETWAANDQEPGK